MGYGPVTPGRKQLPITPWEGSWAQREQVLRESKNTTSRPVYRPPNGQWPLGHSPHSTVLPGR